MASNRLKVVVIVVSLILMFIFGIWAISAYIQNNEINSNYHYWDDKTADTSEEITQKNLATDKYNEKQESGDLKYSIYIGGIFSICCFIIFLFIILPFKKKSKQDEGIKDTNSVWYKNRKKILISLFIIISLMLSIGIYYIMDNHRYNLEQEIHRLNDNLNSTLIDINYSNDEMDELKSTKEKYQDYLEQNDTELHLLKEGDKYTLHNPLYDEAVEFIAQDDNENCSSILDNAKGNGIRCAYVEARVSDEGSYSLLAFDTIDNGMIYFEPGTDYIVNPKIGKSYVDCISGSPYYSLINDTITQLLVFW